MTRTGQMSPNLSFYPCQPFAGRTMIKIFMSRAVKLKQSAVLRNLQHISAVGLALSRNCTAKALTLTSQPRYVVEIDGTVRL
jgi:hypothetical protein